MNAAFIIWLSTRGYSTIVLVDHAVAPNARAVLLPDVVMPPELCVAANEAAP